MLTNVHKKIKVLVVDDHPVFAHGTVSLLSAEPLFSVIGTAKSGRECLQMVIKSKPDVVLLDINLPDTCGIDLVEKLKGILPQVKIIMITGYNPKEYLHDSLIKGVYGFLLKDCSENEIVQAVRKANEDFHKAWVAV